MTEQVRIKLARTATARSPLIILGCFDDGQPTARRLAPKVADAANRARQRRAWRGASGQRSEAELGDGASRLMVLHGLGSRDDFDRIKLATWVRRLGVELRSHGVASAMVVPPEHQVTTGFANAESMLRQMMQLDYRFDQFRRDGGKTRIRALTIVPPSDQTSPYQRARAVARATTAGVHLARDLANTPPNVATPAWIAARARKLASTHGMKATVLGPRELKRRGMGGILAVGGGSSNTPRLVKLEWGRGKRTVALVGKGVTFDTGGISIKPAAAMDEMKYDKSGACTVLGVARAVAELEVPIRLRVYLPLAENMPDGRAYRPGDIVTCHNKKTVEIRNTDAEGRMILADALSWAAREKPHYLLDYATLTGACVVALGNDGAGLFTPDDALAESLLQAAGDADELLWRLPLWPQFLRGMKGVHADLKNSGARWGGASMAAAFLSEFVGTVRQWAHLDIAGPAYVGNSQSGSKGATGYGVALAIHWLRSLAR